MNMTDEELLFKILESYGVPRHLARSVHNGIHVLVNRMQKEINQTQKHNKNLEASNASLRAGTPQSDELIETLKQLREQRNENQRLRDALKLASIKIIEAIEQIDA